MDEHILSATIAGDEAVASFGIEPLHRAGLLDRCAGRWPVRCPRPETRSSLCHWSGGAAIDAEDFGDVWPFVSWADAHFEGFTRLHCVDPALSEDAPMEEGVARPIGEFDEAKPLLGIEPLDDTTDWWRPWVVGNGVELATPRMSKILISQLWFSW